MGTHSGCFDGLGADGKMVEALLDEATNDAVRIEEEVAPTGVLVSDDGVQCLELGGLWEGEDGRRQRCGRRLG